MKSIRDELQRVWESYTGATGDFRSKRPKLIFDNGADRVYEVSDGLKSAFYAALGEEEPTPVLTRSTNHWVVLDDRLEDLNLPSHIGGMSSFSKSKTMQEMVGTLKAASLRRLVEEVVKGGPGSGIVGHHTDRQAEHEHLKRLGWAMRGNVHVKVITHPWVPNHFAVLTTVDNIRREPTDLEPPLKSIPEAQLAALDQLDNPRPKWEPPEPVKPVEKPNPFAGQKLPGYKISAVDAADKYAKQGLSRARAWDQYVIDTQLRPDVSAGEFYAEYDKSLRLYNPSLAEPQKPKTGRKKR